MADQKTYTFIVSDEAVVNCYGFRVMTAGIQLQQYKKNSLVYWMHKRPRQWGGENNVDTEVLPIGKCVKLWKKDGKLYADIVFDEKDEFAQKIAQKVEDGYIKMSSPGLNPIDTSDDAKWLLPGQTRRTLVKSNLEEISIVDIGGNDNALRVELMNASHEIITLSKDGKSDIVPLLSKQNNNNNNHNSETKDFEMELRNQVAAALKLSAGASDEAIMEVLNGKITLANTSEAYKADADKYKLAAETAADKAVVDLVAANVDKKFVKAEEAEILTLCKSLGVEQAGVYLSKLPDLGDGRVTRTLNRKPAAGGADEQQPGEYKNFLELKAEGMNTVQLFKKEHPAEYIKLYKAEYGCEPQLTED